MPRTKRGPTERKNVRIPKAMMDAVETVVEEHPDLFLNRQQFIESAIREKLEVFQGLRAEGPS